MLILGNDKLYEYISAETSERQELDDLYIWFASVIEINDAKCYVFTNKFSGLTTFSYDIGDEIDFGRDFIGSIAALLESNSLNINVIVKYFQDAGDVYFDIAEENSLHGFNNIIDFLIENDHLIDKGSVIQHALNNKINRLDMNFGEETHQPIELFNDRLRMSYGDTFSIFETVGVVLEVTRDDNDDFYRKMVIPMDFYFNFVHHSIELSVNGDKSWHHEFVVTLSDDDSINIVSDDDTIKYKDDVAGMFESQISLRDIAYSTKSIIYASDAKPNNVYNIRVAGVVDQYNQNYPQILEMKGNLEEDRETLTVDELNEVYSLVFNV